MNNPKFKIGDKVNAKWMDVDYEGTIVFVFTEPLKDKTQQSYLVQGRHFYLYDSDKEKQLTCSMDILLWPESCLTFVMSEIQVGEYVGKISPDGQSIKVGCQTITRDSVAAVLDRMNAIAKI